MLMPRKMKFRKAFRGTRKGNASRGFELNFGRYGLKSEQGGWITARQIESARRAMTRYIKREGQVWIKVFPDKPVSATPAETGMGGGKGTVDHYVCNVFPGTVIFELDGVAQDIAKEAIRLASHKLPVKCRFVEKK